MKSKLTIIMLALLVMGCAGSKKAVYTPSGTWEFTVYSTPIGDATGEMVLVDTEEGLEGSFNSLDYGNAKLNNLVYGEEKTITCNFYMADTDHYLKGTFEVDTFTGTIDSADGSVYNMTASRKIEND